jgi:hypothetical protein
MRLTDEALLELKTRKYWRVFGFIVFRCSISGTSFEHDPVVLTSLFGAPHLHLWMAISLYFRCCATIFTTVYIGRWAAVAGVINCGPSRVLAVWRFAITRQQDGVNRAHLMWIKMPRYHLSGLLPLPGGRGPVRGPDLITGGNPAISFAVAMFFWGTAMICGRKIHEAFLL